MRWWHCVVLLIVRIFFSATKRVGEIAANHDRAVEIMRDQSQWSGVLPLKFVALETPDTVLADRFRTMHAPL
jgi:hypothetical protein